MIPVSPDVKKRGFFRDEGNPVVPSPPLVMASQIRGGGGEAPHPLTPSVQSHRLFVFFKRSDRFFLLWVKLYSVPVLNQLIMCSCVPSMPALT